MKKYIVLSVNDNQDYLYYAPLCCWAWRQFGWDPIVMYRGEINAHLQCCLSSGAMTKDDIFFVQNIPGYRSDTVTQMSRLYAACILDNGYMMTGDIDMIPLSDYWNPDRKKITIYGHDLTGYGHYPICYIGMPPDLWVSVFGLSSTDYHEMIKRDLDSLPQAKDEDFYKYWFTDQDFATERIKATQFEKDFINRGQYSNGYARGRVDRGAWTLDHEQFIDAHLHRDLFKSFYPNANDTHVKKFADTMRLLYRIWPNEDFDWFVEYTKEYAKLSIGK